MISHDIARSLIERALGHGTMFKAEFYSIHPVGIKNSFAAYMMTKHRESFTAPHLAEQWVAFLSGWVAKALFDQKQRPGA